jgi:hypothetical protein
MNTECIAAPLPNSLAGVKRGIIAKFGFVALQNKTCVPCHARKNSLGRIKTLLGSAGCLSAKHHFPKAGVGDQAGRVPFPHPASFGFGRC